MEHSQATRGHPAVDRLERVRHELSEDGRRLPSRTVRNTQQHVQQPKQQHRPHCRRLPCVKYVSYGIRGETNATHNWWGVATRGGISKRIRIEVNPSYSGLKGQHTVVFEPFLVRPPRSTCNRGTTCSDHGECTQDDTCVCHTGWAGQMRPRPLRASMSAVHRLQAGALLRQRQQIGERRTPSGDGERK